MKHKSIFLILALALCAFNAFSQDKITIVGVGVVDCKIKQIYPNEIIFDHNGEQKRVPIELVSKYELANKSQSDSTIKYNLVNTSPDSLPSTHIINAGMHSKNSLVFTGVSAGLFIVGSAIGFTGGGAIVATAITIGGIAMAIKSIAEQVNSSNELVKAGEMMKREGH